MSGKPPFLAGMVGDMTENIFHIAGLISQELGKLRNISDGFGGFSGSLNQFLP
jgi:hypothetical protein